MRVWNGEEITPELKKVWAKMIYRSLRQDYKSWIKDIVRQIKVADSKGDVKAVHRLAGVLQGNGNVLVQISPRIKIENTNHRRRKTGSV